MQITQNLEPSIEIPSQILKIYDVLEDQFTNRKDWQRMHETTLWKHLCLCILSSNVNFELAKSALLQLVKTNLLLPSRILKKEYISQKKIGGELAKPIYQPRKKDGTFRKYRFPTIRAANIVSAARTLYSDGKDIRKLLQNLESEEAAREYLTENVSGLGLKESSHFLRNIKYSSSLAIIDVHILSFLQEIGLISIQNGIITRNHYLILEKLMQQISKNYGLNLSIFDNAIWYYMRYRTNS